MLQARRYRKTRHHEKNRNRRSSRYCDLVDMAFSIAGPYEENPNTTRKTGVWGTRGA
jgi:hypothetical protein